MSSREGAVRSYLRERVTGSDRVWLRVGNMHSRSLIVTPPRLAGRRERVDSWPPTPWTRVWRLACHRPPKGSVSSTGRWPIHPPLVARPAGPTVSYGIGPTGLWFHQEGAHAPPWGHPTAHAPTWVHHTPPWGHPTAPGSSIRSTWKRPGGGRNRGENRGTGRSMVYHERSLCKKARKHKVF